MTNEGTILVCPECIGDGTLGDAVQTKLRAEAKSAEAKREGLGEDAVADVVVSEAEGR